MTPDVTPHEAADSLTDHLRKRTGRRSFLKWSGAAVATMAVVGACDDDDNIIDPDPDPDPASVSLDFSSDFGVLNYAYALEQLEAAFYTAVVASFYTGATADEQSILRDLRDHEVAHRELFKSALGDNAIPGLTPVFTTVNFNSRASVLGTAQIFEDLGVAAYNGAGKYLTNPDYLVVAGKIVSVEARHASIIRTLLGNPFAPNAFDEGMTPQQVLQAADPFIENTITTQNA